jgi:hypothetical protein
MGYLKCKSCGGRYDLQPGELPGDFDSCSCGGKLEFYDSHGHKRGYKPVYSVERKSAKLHPLLKILIFIVIGLLFLNIFSGMIMYLLLSGLKFVGPSGGTYLFVIFFGICIAIILGLLWFLFRKR